MKSFSLSTLAFASMAFIPALARAEVPPELVTAPVDRAFVPLGFDSNDDAEIVVYGHFPNTCFKVGPATASVDYETSTITVEATAYSYAGLQCGQVLVPFTESLSLGMVKAGTYRVVVKDRPAATTSDLVVVEATTDSPDDYLYAPVEQASLSVRADGQKMLKVEGAYPFCYVGCMVMHEVRIHRTPGNVVVVQPIAELTDGRACDGQRGTKNFSIETPVTDSLEGGDYLLHVRALSGKAVNRVVTINAR